VREIEHTRSSKRSWCVNQLRFCFSNLLTPVTTATLPRRFGTALLCTSDFPLIGTSFDSLQGNLREGIPNPHREGECLGTGRDLAADSRGRQLPF